MTALLLAAALTVPAPAVTLEGWQQAHERFPWWVPAPPTQVVPVSTDPVERWRPLVAEHFEAEDVDLALRIIGCESDGIPTAANPTSTARGLWQHLRGWWSGAWGGTGAFDPFDPEQSMEAAAWLVYADGWHHWNASKGCWG